MAFENKIIESLRKYQWPKGIVCPECRSKRIYTIKDKAKIKKYTCKDCLRRFSDISSTVFHKTRLSLDKWLDGYELIRLNPNLSARNFKNQLHISYTAARRIKRLLQEKADFFEHLLKIVY